MLSKLAEKYYSSTYDLNCAEAIIYAANEEYKLNLQKETLKAMSGFGGGMAVEGVCGAAAGAVAVLGILFTKEKAHETEGLKELTADLVNRVEDRLKTINCKELKDLYRDDITKCKLVVIATADILDDIVTNERTKDLRYND
ncbi:C-GCAxxG-C-C family (seleno)protein [Alkaliphilus peptidifermentans]|uniref:C_GCAxxG_C_C family probable redox protein n=1 Tax=Alkaliphilus peptidifermentans DSM 18978 TaxID=1120976 RepID=A0A1G5IWY4_9FIRM|nr:C-GCAxxG-C-C family (seleno)protein [Alkaliphilus peptidifermentans]SCY80139.1 C_GCAxxG_C_C family probable redox protein [Alkaliphilus peptidifermentans DSM 18978]